MTLQPLPREARDAADAWWAQDFAIEPAALHPRQTWVQAHRGRLADATGISVLVAGGSPVVSMPAAVYAALGAAARRWTRDGVADGAALARAIAPFEAVKVVGPAFIGYGTRDTLDLSDAGLARELSGSSADERAVQALRAECTEEEWQHGGCGAHRAAAFAASAEDGRLGSLASYAVWGRLAHISVITGRAQRGRGSGRAVVALAAQHALDAGLIPQYRTLHSNAPSMALGRRLGFREYGFSMYVRL